MNTECILGYEYSAYMNVMHVGMLVSECRQIFYAGITNHLNNMYNIVNLTVLSLYTACFILRFITYRWVMAAEEHCNATASAREALLNRDYSQFDRIVRRAKYADTDFFRYIIEASMYFHTYTRINISICNCIEFIHMNAFNLYYSY
jgi:hypothetical protein